MTIKNACLLMIFAGLWTGSVFSANRPPDARAECISRTPAKYPASLIDTLSRGFASLWVEVGEDGKVGKIQVLRATHPDFVLPAINAVREWEFLPALKGGKPVKSAGIQNLWFDIQNAPGISIAGFSFGIKPVPRARLPKEQRYDVAPEVLTVVNPVYPYALAIAAVKGAAKVEFELGADGVVSEVRAVESTHPELIASMRAMLEACVIHAARKGKEPIASWLTRSQKFGPGENNLHFDKQTRMVLEELRADTPAIVEAGELDRSLQPIHQPLPAYPSSMLQRQISGEALIEFIVDHHGRAQLPRIVTTTNEDFGWSAATAVQQWLFSPPTKEGKPVFVRFAVPLEFKLNSRKPE